MDKAELLKKIKKIKITSSKFALEGVSGSFRSYLRGAGLDFAGVRKYSIYDDWRSIDWNATARTGTAHTRFFTEERELPLFLLIDFSASMYSGAGKKGISKKDSAVLAAAHLAFAAGNMGEKSGAAFFTNKIEKSFPLKKGIPHIINILASACDLPPEGRGSDLTNAVSAIPSLFLRRGICAVISDFRTDIPWKLIADLSVKTEFIFLRIYGETDASLPVSSFFMQDPENKNIPVFYSGISEKLHNSYSSYWKNRCSELQKKCMRYGVPYLEISTDDDAGEKLLKFFEKRKQR